MLDYKPAYARPVEQIRKTPFLGASVYPPSLGAEPAPPPTPTVDAVFAGYQGLPGIISTVGLLAITGSAAWIGIKTALNTQDKVTKAAGWVGGVGSALLGLFYLGQKSGLTIGTQVPGVNVYPA
jgi:hypothetical protein